MTLGLSPDLWSSGSPIDTEHTHTQTHLDERRVRQVCWTLGRCVMGGGPSDLKHLSLPRDFSLRKTIGTY